MERALLQGEREAERALLQKEQKAVDQLQEKLMTLETSIQKERDKVTHNLAWLCAGRQRPGRGGEVPFTPYLIIHPTGAGGLVLGGKYQRGGCCQGLGWCLGSPLPGFLFFLWVPGCLPFWALRAPSWKCRSPFLGGEHCPGDRCWGVIQVQSLHWRTSPPSRALGLGT